MSRLQSDKELMAKLNQGKFTVGGMFKGKNAKEKQKADIIYRMEETE